MEGTPRKDCVQAVNYAIADQGSSVISLLIEEIDVGNVQRHDKDTAHALGPCFCDKMARVYVFHPKHVGKKPKWWCGFGLLP